MAEVGKVYPAEIHLLKKAIEAQGELLNNEILERKADIDRLKLEVETLKKLLEKFHPGFLKQYAVLYGEERLRFNPEFERKILG